MTKFQLNRPGAPWDYPTLGFTATADGAILDGTLFNPDLTIPPDAYWSVYGGGSAETSITRYATPSEEFLDPTPEITEGWLLAYDPDANTYTPQDPADLIETGAWSTPLSAAIGSGLTDDGEPLRAGYDAPGAGTTAAFSVDGHIVATGGPGGDHRIWTNSPGSNTLSIRNTYVPDAEHDSDSAIRFLRASDGLEIGAVGVHNGDITPNSPFSGDGNGVMFVESSAYLELDGNSLSGDEPDAPPLRLITTGKFDGISFGPAIRIGMESDGSTAIFYPSVDFSIARRAVDVRPQDGGVDIDPVLRVKATSGTPNLILGDVYGANGYRMEVGYHFTLGGAGGMAVINAYRAGVGNRPVAIAPYGNDIYLIGDGGANGVGGGTGVIFIGNSAAAPSGNPTAGHLLYADTGALKGRGASGTVTTIAAADPHCSDCGRDFALEWENAEYGYLALCMWCVSESMTKGVMARQEAVPA